MSKCRSISVSIEEIWMRNGICKKIWQSRKNKKARRNVKLHSIQTSRTIELFFARKRREIPRWLNPRKAKDPRQLDALIRIITKMRVRAYGLRHVPGRGTPGTAGEEKKGEEKERRSVIRGRRKYPMRKRVDDWNIKRTARVIRFRTIEFADSRGRAPNLSQNLVRETKESRRK